METAGLGLRLGCAWTVLGAGDKMAVDGIDEALKMILALALQLQNFITNNLRKRLQC